MLGQEVGLVVNRMHLHLLHVGLAVRLVRQLALVPLPVQPLRDVAVQVEV